MSVLMVQSNLSLGIIAYVHTTKSTQLSEFLPKHRQQFYREIDTGSLSRFLAMLTLGENTNRAFDVPGRGRSILRKQKGVASDAEGSHYMYHSIDGDDENQDCKRWYKQ